MIGLLRFTGLANAAIWLGASIFGAFVVLPAFFTPGFKAVIHEPYNGLAAQMILHRYLALHYTCGTVAILHLIAGYLYSGRPADRATAATLAMVAALGVLEGVWLEPALKSLFAAKYDPRSTPAAREEAAHRFGPLHGLSQTANLLVLAGVCFYFWKLNRPAGGSRSPGFPNLAG